MNEHKDLEYIQKVTFTQIMRQTMKNLKWIEVKIMKKYQEQIDKYEQTTKRLIPVLLEHSLINEDLDYFDDYLIGGEENA